jgi:hypothetical protein
MGTGRGLVGSLHLVNEIGSRERTQPAPAAAVVVVVVWESFDRAKSSGGGTVARR